MGFTPLQNSTGSEVLTEADFAVPEFKKGSELYGVGSAENYSAMGAPKPKGFVPLGSIPTSGKGFTPISETVLVEQPQKTNWLGTGPEMTTGEYLKSGFAGRGISAAVQSDDALMKQADDSVIASYGLSIKDNPKKYKELWNKEYSALKQQETTKATEEAKQHPEPSMGEAFTQLGHELITSPWKTAKSLLYELGKDPELAVLGGAPNVLKAASATSKLASAVKGVATVGATGASLETFAEAGDKAGLNPQKIANTAAQFAAMAGATKAVGAGLDAIKPNATLKPLASQDAFETELAKAQEDVNRMRGSDTPFDLTFKGKTKEKGETEFEAGNRVRKQRQAEESQVVDTNLPNMPLGKPADGRNQREVTAEILRIEEEQKHRQELLNDENKLKKYAVGRAPVEELRTLLKDNYTHNATKLEELKKALPEAPPANPVGRWKNLPLEEPKTFTEQELADHPSLESLGDVFKGDTHTEQTPVNAIHRVIADISLNDRASKIWRESLERMVPNQKIRERMTMAAEGAKETDRLLTDMEKQELLYGTGKVKPGTQFKDTGLTGALEGMYIKYSKGLFKDEADRLAYKDKLDKLEYTVNMLKDLPSEENAIKVLKVIQDKLDVIGNQAKREGVIDNLRQNYVTHVLDFSDSVLSKAQQQSLRDRILSDKQSRFTRDFAKHRVYKTIRDLEKRLYEAGEEMGLDTRGVKVQRDIARISEVYQKSFVNAIIQKRLTNFLAKQEALKVPKLDKNGKQIGVEHLSLLTKNYEEGFKNGYEKFTGHGAEALKDYMVHPDLIDPLKHLFRQTDPGLVLKAASGISMLSKTVTTMASLFHATSLALARTVATPFGMLKELKTGFSGTRAALDTIRHDGLSKEVDDWARAGLKFETEDIQQGILPGVAKSFDNFVTKLASKDDIRLTRRVIDPLDTHVLQTLNTFTWDFMHSSGKFATAQYLFAKMKVRNPELSDHAIRNEVSAFVNNTFGGLDWLKIADEVQNKTLKKIAMKAYGLQGRTWMQIAMFAPDWTISTLRSYTKALPQKIDPRKWEIKAGAKGLFNPKTSGDLARRYVATNALMWITILNGINIATSGHPIYKNDDPTRIDLGDGTTMQAAKHSMEGPHWLLHPIKTGFNKMGYIPKTVAALGSDYVHTPLDVIKTVAEPFLPFQVSSAIKAPKGEKIKRGVASFVGLPIYGTTNKGHTSPEVMMARKQQRKATMRTNKEKKMEKR